MKVLHIISGMDPKAGGVSQALITMVHGLAAEGIASEVVTMDDPDANFLKNFNFTITGLGPSRTGWRYAPNLLVWLKKNISNYDVVIVHGLWQYHTYAAYKSWNASSERRPKLFIMPHGMLDPYFQKATARMFKAVRNWMIWHFLEKRLVNVANGLLFTCEEEKNLAKQTFTGYHPKRELVVGLGVEKPPQYDSRMTAVFEKIIGKQLSNFLLFISRIDAKKGVDILVKTYILLEKYHNLPPLVIAGPGLDTPYGKSILKIAADHPKVIFPGMLSGDAKWGAFYGCETFILPSHQENFGIAVVEALACAKPVLISDKVNIWAEISSGNSGIIYNDNLADFTNVLEKWAAMTNEEKKQMGQNALNVYMKHYSLGSFISNLREKIQI